MQRNIYDQGVFLWDWNGERSYSFIETDDVLLASVTRAPFVYLQQELEKMFDFTCREGTILKFLNFCIIQSPSGISLDQTQHITANVLAEY